MLKFGGYSYLTEVKGWGGCVGCKTFDEDTQTTLNNEPFHAAPKEQETQNDRATQRAYHVWRNRHMRKAAVHLLSSANCLTHEILGGRKPTPHPYSLVSVSLSRKKEREREREKVKM